MMRMMTLAGGEWSLKRCGVGSMKLMPLVGKMAQTTSHFRKSRPRGANGDRIVNSIAWDGMKRIEQREAWLHKNTTCDTYYI
mmetsp:Transcript_21446/g.30046  ORF Transcript_21446/g.30046 Transcript_21446/m.30046 type:complete len:82 (-) Transcript_21446:87-332(-)